MAETKEIKLYGGKELVYYQTNPWHKYWDSKHIPLLSVTGITGVVDKSAPLMFWAVKLAKNYMLDNWNVESKYTESQKAELLEEASKQYREFKKKAADIGTQIHEWVGAFITGQKPEMPEDEKVVNGITAFLKFQKENKVKWLESERTIFSKKYRYAGHLDAIGKMNKDLTMFDFKSSNGLYDEMRFQVAGYRAAWEEEMGPKITQSILLRFGKDTGEFEVHKLPDYEKDREAFLACLQLKRRLEELKIPFW